MFSAEQLIIKILQQKANGNPIMSNAINLYQNGKFDEIETLARDLCKQRGLDADAMAKQIKSQFMQ